MTQEEKAKAYDDAIDKVAHFVKKHVGLGCLIHPNSSEAKELFNIFPEFAESEDEQHRKWILDYLYDGWRKSDEQFKDQFKSAIDWLEKQGEQKPIDKVEPKFKVGDSYGCHNATPATKEQSDLLFQKIKEVGYEWISDKKDPKVLVRR